MALAYKIGEAVREKVFVMTDGVVKSATIGDTDGVVYFLVGYTDADGNAQERYIAEDLLETVG